MLAIRAAQPHEVARRLESVTSSRSAPTVASNPCPPARLKTFDRIWTRRFSLAVRIIDDSSRWDTSQPTSLANAPSCASGTQPFWLGHPAVLLFFQQDAEFSRSLLWARWMLRSVSGTSRPQDLEFPGRRGGRCANILSLVIGELFQCRPQHCRRVVPRGNHRHFS